MKRRSILLSAALIGTLFLSGISASASGQAVNVANYARNAPGTQYLERGNRFYEQGDFDAAAGYYRLAARWADKLAQFNLGMLHVNGKGVPRDPLRGWAWIELASERGYPTYEAVADDIWDQLSEDHRKAARAILEQELEPEFGDEVAVRRTSNAMRRERNSTTSGGSRVGANRVRYVVSRDGTFESGEQFLRDELWDFEKIIAFETRLYKAMASGSVTVRELELPEDEAAGQDDEFQDDESSTESDPGGD